MLGAKSKQNWLGFNSAIANPSAMTNETQDVEARKLAAARKMLKEYKQRTNNYNPDETSSTVSIVSNLSKRSDCEFSNKGGIQNLLQCQILHTLYSQSRQQGWSKTYGHTMVKETQICSQFKCSLPKRIN